MRLPIPWEMAKSQPRIYANWLINSYEIVKPALRPKGVSKGSRCVSTGIKGRMGVTHPSGVLRSGKERGGTFISFGERLVQKRGFDQCGASRSFL